MAREDSAPEVALSSQPERRWAGASEGLQHAGIDGKEARIAAASNEKEADEPSEKSRSKWPALLVVGAIAAIIEIGIGYAAGNGNNEAVATSK